MSDFLGSVSSIPTSPSNTGKGPQTLTRRGGEAEPSKSFLIRDPVLRAAFEAAYDGWARKYPELLKDWPA